MTTYLGLPTAPPGVGHLRGSEPFPVAARRALADTQLRANLAMATATIRAKRAAVVAELGDWEELRAAGQAAKAGAMRHLDRYLEQLETRVQARGGTVHWARDAVEANQIVASLVDATGSREVVKVKSMVTDEIGLNEALAAAGITAHETDLAELIVQLGHDRPSHILVPAIHLNRAEIREIFLREMADVDPALTDQPGRAGRGRPAVPAAQVPVGPGRHQRRQLRHRGDRHDLRGRVRGQRPDVPDPAGHADHGHGNREGAAELGGPRRVHAAAARSSTGERMNPYTSMWTGVTPGDGPQHFHLVLVDNGRTAVLADQTGRQALHCIRCSACLNVCPVYERVGGHAYGSVYPGPIGAVLSPQLTGVEENPTLPYASSLCGACYDVCPVKIDIPSILVHLRARHVDEARGNHRLPRSEAIAMSAAAWVMAGPGRFAAAQRASRLGRALGRRRGRIGQLPPPLSAWTRARDLPVPPVQTFRQWWRDVHEKPS